MNGRWITHTALHCADTLPTTHPWPWPLRFFLTCFWMEVSAAGLSSHELTTTPLHCTDPSSPIYLACSHAWLLGCSLCIWMVQFNIYVAVMVLSVPGLSLVCISYLLNIDLNVLFSIQEASLSFHAVLFLSALHLTPHLQSLSMPHSYKPFRMSTYIHYVMYV